MTKRAHSQKGFTLFELMAAIVILAILAALSLKIADGRKRAYLAVIQTDLRNIATAQEGYWYDSYDEPGGPRYAPNLAQLDWNVSADVQMTMVGIAIGWSARAVHKKRNDFRCAMYVGDVKGLIQIYEPAIEEGVMECEPKMGKGQSK
ncbi:MAG: type II secretion system protein [Gemmatimonadota bacterium]|nr:MAG: type II secretion system protein [Gemmatimonadota bacterium]